MKNIWLRLAQKVGPEIGQIFSGKRGGSFYEVAWRMGLIRTLRACVSEKVMYDLFADQSEPRYWWGSWNLWRVAQVSWQKEFYSDLAKVLPFAKFCFAYDEIRRAAVENPGMTPDTPPATEEDRQRIYQEVAESLEDEEDGDYAGVDKMESMMQSVFQRWLDHRICLTAEEWWRAKSWADLVGGSDLSPAVDPPRLWGQFLLENFRRQKV